MNCIKFLSLMIIIASTTSAYGTSSQEIEKCELTYNTGSIQSALRYCEIASKLPNARSSDLFRYGKLLLSQVGRNPPNPEAAYIIFEKIADDNPGALYNLGLISYQKRDYVTSFNYFYKASEMHHPGAIFRLAELYRNGKGTETDFKEAFRLYQKSALLGDPHAMAALGELYSLGNPVFSVKESYYWTLAASKNGEYEAKNNLNIYAKRLSSSEQNTQQQRLKDFEDSLENSEELCLKLNQMDSLDAAFGFCKRASTNSDNPMIYETLGSLYQANILNRLSDDIEAFRWLVKAADSKSVTAQYKVGLYYAKKIHSNLIKADYPTAIKYLEMAAINGHQNACLELGIIYEQKLGTPKDIKTATNWYEKAAYLGNEEGAYYLGLNLLHQKNYKDATFWLVVAKKMGV